MGQFQKWPCLVDCLAAITPTGHTRPTFANFKMNREAFLWRGRIDIDASGKVVVPEGPGLGYIADEGVMERYRVS